jgi:hypothetical protein
VIKASEPEERKNVQIVQFYRDFGRSASVEAALPLSHGIATTTRDAHLTLRYIFIQHIGDKKDKQLKVIFSKTTFFLSSGSEALITEYKVIQFREEAVVQHEHTLQLTVSSIYERTSIESKALKSMVTGQQTSWSRVRKSHPSVTGGVTIKMIASKSVDNICNMPQRC